MTTFLSLTLCAGPCGGRARANDNPPQEKTANPKVYLTRTITPEALDKACVDLVYASDDPGKVHLIERIESRHGTHTLDHAAAIGLGDPDYELIDIDN